MSGEESDRVTMKKISQIFFLIGFIAIIFVCDAFLSNPSRWSTQATFQLNHRKLQMDSSSRGFGSGDSKQPNIIKPKGATNKSALGLEKFLMMYTCKLCNGRNAQMVCSFVICHFNYAYVIIFVFILNRFNIESI